MIRLHTCANSTTVSGTATATLDLEIPVELTTWRAADIPSSSVLRVRHIALRVCYVVQRKSKYCSVLRSVGAFVGRAEWHRATVVPTSQVRLRSLRYATQTFTWPSILISICDMGLSLFCVADGCNWNLGTARYQTRMPEMAVLLGRAHVTTTTCAWRVFSRAHGMVKQTRTHRVLELPLSWLFNTINVTTGAEIRSGRAVRTSSSIASGRSYRSKVLIARAPVLHPKYSPSSPPSRPPSPIIDSFFYLCLACTVIPEKMLL